MITVVYRNVGEGAHRAHRGDVLVRHYDNIGQARDGIREILNNTERGKWEVVLAAEVTRLFKPSFTRQITEVYLTTTILAEPERG